MTKLVVYGAPKLLVTTKDPWYTKRKFFLKDPPPWAKERQYLSYIFTKPAMARAVSAFAFAGHATAGIDRWQRREIMHKALKVGPGFYGGQVRERRPKVSEARISELVSSITALANQVKNLPASEAITRTTALIRGGA